MKTNFQRLQGRLITVNGVRWKVKTGKSHTVARSEYGLRFCDFNSSIKGIDPYLFERGQYKKTKDGMLTPKEISKWILNNFIKLHASKTH